ncbi:nucleotidyl transferase AbiEii/AbiGii toxin family protein [Candidatus Uhrbacteria bacterium]|nr:nucleotidyl transferase AbiEii/AbiGii toxin family protein [Candidatus Uhrbacteria bacterium]
MEQTILTPWQETVLSLVNAKPELQDFYLSGGTALAGFYLHHRFSDDLDFFTGADPDPVSIEQTAKDIAANLGATTRYEKLHDRRMFFFQKNGDELKVEFTKYPFPQLEHTQPLNGIRVDSLRDIAANKLTALIDRFDPKDFVDLYFLLQQTDLETVRADAEKKFSFSISSLFLGGELAKVSRIEALPRMVKPLTIEMLRSFFVAEAKRLKPQVFDEPT